MVVQADHNFEIQGMIDEVTSLITAEFSSRFDKIYGNPLLPAQIEGKGVYVGVYIKDFQLRDGTIGAPYTRDTQLNIDILVSRGLDDHHPYQEAQELAKDILHLLVGKSDFRLNFEDISNISADFNLRGDTEFIAVDAALSFTLEDHYSIEKPHFTDQAAGIDIDFGGLNRQQNSDF